jgi:hypothetical protein
MNVVDRFLQQPAVTASELLDACRCWVDVTLGRIRFD